MSNDTLNTYVLDSLNKLVAPLLRVEKAPLFSVGRPTFSVILSLDPRETWVNGILESNYSVFFVEILQDGRVKIKQIVCNWVTRKHHNGAFRTRTTAATKARETIQAWIDATLASVQAKGKEDHPSQPELAQDEKDWRNA